MSDFDVLPPEPPTDADAWIAGGWETRPVRYRWADLPMALRFAQVTWLDPIDWYEPEGERS